jgi:Flp pilus assembly protein TadD
MHRRALRIVLSLTLAAALASAACAPRAPRDSRAAAAVLAARNLARSQALIDSGNVLFRVKDFAGAAKRYGAAAVVKPDDPAAYYGLGMALARLGRDEDARLAYSRARELAQQARQAPGDSTSGR